MRFHRLPALLLAAAMVATACGDDDAATAAGDAEGTDRPLVVVSASLLGDVVQNVVGDQADVEVLIPAGADPHDFQLSARQAARIREADALVVNGGGFEEGLVDALESAEDDGVPTFEALDAVEPLADEPGGGVDDHAHEEHDDHAHEGETEGEAHREEGEDDHAHEDGDPHFFTDPLRMADAVREIGPFLAGVEGIDAEAVERSAEAYASELEELHAEVEATLAEVPDDRRVLVTNHDVLAYFADRYDFEIVGVVVPGGATDAAGSAGDLARLAETIRETGVPAIFADSSSPDELTRTLAEEAGQVQVVPLFTESLGEEGSGGETYVDMVRTNAERIAQALGDGSP